MVAATGLPGLRRARCARCGDCAPDQVREVYERAIANVPPGREKRYWQRYIFLWVRYALWEELDGGDPERAREVYRTCLGLIPHSTFTFAKARGPSPVALCSPGSSAQPACCGVPFWQSRPVAAVRYFASYHPCVKDLANAGCQGIILGGQTRDGLLLSAALGRRRSGSWRRSLRSGRCGWGPRGSCWAPPLACARRPSSSGAASCTRLHRHERCMGQRPLLHCYV